MNSRRTVRLAAPWVGGDRGAGGHHGLGTTMSAAGAQGSGPLTVGPYRDAPQAVSALRGHPSRLRQALTGTRKAAIARQPADTP